MKPLIRPINLRPEFEPDTQVFDMDKVNDLYEYIAAFEEIRKHSGVDERKIRPYLNSSNTSIVLAAAEAISLTNIGVGTKGDLIRIYNALERVDPEQLEWNNDLLTDFFLHLCEGRTGAYVVRLTKEEQIEAKGRMLSLIRKEIGGQDT